MPSPIFDGAEMRRRRQALDITPTEFAVRIDRCAETVRFYELGLRSPSLSALCAISDELGCKPTDLLVKRAKK